MSKDDVRDYRSLGEILRDAREAKDWTLEDLHERTRIAPRMLQALETDDIDQFDSPVYVRGFLRQLSGPLDLDPDWLLTKLGVPERPVEEPPAAVLPPESAPTPTPEAPPTAPPVSERGPVWEVEAVRVRKVDTSTGGGGSSVVRGVVIAVVALTLVAIVVFWLRSRDERSPDAEELAARDVPVQQPAALDDTPEDAAEDAAAVASPDGSARDADEAPDPVADDPEPSPASDSEVELVADAVGLESSPPSGVRADALLEWNPSTAPEAIAARAAAERAKEVSDPTPEPSVDSDPTPPPVDAAADANDEAETAKVEVDDTPAPVTRAAPDRGGRERNEVVESSGLDRGLPSVVRTDADEAVPPMRLVIRASQRVEVDVTPGGGESQTRRLEAGEAWEIVGVDHFLVRASDPGAAEFELDGILRDPPPRWTGSEWFLYRPTDNDAE